jgi:hypothetical protein
MTTEDELIRARVRIEQLESVLRDFEAVATDENVPDWTLRERVISVSRAHLPTPPSPPTEAYVHRELQAGEDGL